MEKLVKLFNKKISQKGMTLVEVLVAIMILTIIVIAFTGLISWNFTNIFNMGEKSRAIAKAMEKTDQLTNLVWNAEDSDEALTALQNPDIGWVLSNELLDADSEECVFSFDKVNKVVDDTEVEGYEVSVVVFYQDFKYHVQLDSFILQYPDDI